MIAKYDVAVVGGRIAYVYSFETSDSRIHFLYAVANPDKRKYLKEAVR
ncbi:hypothetical protein FHS19_003032 [Paenibacillus rhizosphaerae]|uniref:Uncharacterized protein n=1 Tax=Paenibacillus rhizosphaerae TaxID=297318 RepID=A0A839TSM9_9BACL|nr:hypothetical protein [Paenibacillus rhizosphaerae]MBB3128378.1 hypothetical protein [Paenibacillus rhizosphaerae]